MTVQDVIVIGLGGMGSAAACHLARRGLRVLGLEQFQSAHDRGSSHGATRVIRQCYFEHPAYVPLLLRAYELWHELETSTDTSLLQLNGGLMLGHPQSEVVRGSLHSAQMHGLPHEWLEAAALRRRFPQFRVPDGSVGLLEPHAGLVRPEAAVRAHQAAAQRAGATLRFEEPVLGWEALPGGGVRVRTAAGVYEAGRLVLTPGPWAPALLAELGVPLAVERQVLIWFQPRHGVNDFLPDRFPIFIAEDAAGRQPYGFPAVDGPEGGVKVAFFRKPTREICTPETVDRQIRPDDIENLRETIREVLPALDGPFLRGTVCLYTVTPDLNFVLGPHPHCADAVVGCGFSGHGYKFCSVMGEVLADLATTGRSRFDLGLFHPRRFDGAAA